MALDIPTPTLDLSTLRAPQQQPFLQSLAQYMPAASAGFAGLGTIFSLIQAFQRMKQLADLRKFYRNWQQAGNYRLSQLVGDAASRGLSGSPNALAGLVASAYAPFQLQAGQGMLSATTSAPGVANPFDAFLKGLEAYRSATSPLAKTNTTPSTTSIDTNFNSTRGGSIDSPIINPGTLLDLGNTGE